MKNTFFEYYQTSDEDLKKIWEDCFFSLDANVLLNFYRYTEATRNKFFEVLKNIEDKLIITHQAGFEFHKNRLTTINSQQKAYDNLTSFFSKKCNEIESELNNYKKHSYLQIGSISEEINKTFEKVNKDIEELKKKHPDLIDKDEIKNAITELFDKKITGSYDKESLTKIYKEGKERYENEIPPGYKDYKQKKNNDENSLYGDYIIWCQIMDFAKEKKKSIIFITDDLKEDWWYKFNGKTISPRPELLKEFFEITEQKILIYNADSFLLYSKNQMGTDIDDTILEEIKNLRLKDENYLYYQNLKNLNKLFSIQNKTLRKSFDKEIFNHLIKSDLNDSEYYDLYRKFLENYLSENLENKKRKYTELEKEQILKYLIESKDFNNTQRIMIYNILKKYFRDSKDDNDENLELV